MPKKDLSWIQDSGIYGTWTFTTQTMTDAGYFKGISYVVMHVMPDPMRVKSCEIQKNPNNSSESCREENNLACSHGGAPNDVKEVCVDTETTQLEWSDGACLCVNTMITVWCVVSCRVSCCVVVLQSIMDGLLFWCVCVLCCVVLPIGAFCWFAVCSVAGSPMSFAPKQNSNLFSSHQTMVLCLCPLRCDVI